MLIISRPPIWVTNDTIKRYTAIQIKTHSKRYRMLRTAMAANGTKPPLSMLTILFSRDMKRKRV
jgi:hypothetical protein